MVPEIRPGINASSAYPASMSARSFSVPSPCCPVTPQFAASRRPPPSLC